MVFDISNVSAELSVTVFSIAHETDLFCRKRNIRCTFHRRKPAPRCLMYVSFHGAPNPKASACLQENYEELEYGLSAVDVCVDVRCRSGKKTNPEKNPRTTHH